MPKRILPTRSWSLILGFALLVAVVAASALFVELQQSGDARIRQNLIVQAKLAEIQSVMQDAESGQRGYLLTNDKQYLEPYESAIATIGGNLAALEGIAENKPGFREQFGQLRVLIDGKLAELRATIIQHNSGDAVGALAIVVATPANRWAGESGTSSMACAGKRCAF